MRHKLLVVFLSVSVVILGAIPILLVRSAGPSLKYFYTVRENIDQGQNSVSWDLYCWHEYSNHKTIKKFVEHNTMTGTNVIPDKVETSLCKQ